MAADKTPGVRAVEIHGTLQLEPAAVEARLKKIEEKLDGKKEKGALSWILDVLKILLPSIVLALIGFYLKDTVDQALHEHQLQIEAVKQMQQLTEDLQKTQLRPDADAKAAQLAAFGRYSVPFFVNVLEVGSQNNGVGAEDGLRMVARSEPQPVCLSLQAVIRNRSGLYRWQTHLSALKVLGQVGCTETLKDVTDYLGHMSSVDNYKKWAAGDPQSSEYDSVKNQAALSLEQLNGAQELKSRN